MRKSGCLKIFLFIFFAFFCFMAGEIVIRMSGRFDADGNFFFHSRRLRPYRLPIATTRETLNEYYASSTGAVIYDPILGWSYRPNSQSADTLCYFNADSIRMVSIDYPISKSPSKDTLRIAIVGGSSTQGGEVPFENTWGYYLEDDLKRAGINAEVLNFGVGGYGIDQALLRWKELGSQFSPHIVILGLCFENVKRNVNLFRSIYLYGIGAASSRFVPFSKPRYILKEGELKLINTPTIKPERLISVMENIESWDMMKYEWWYDSEDYRPKVWLRSKFIAALSGAINQIKLKMTGHDPEEFFYSLHREPAQLTLKIVQEFKKDVESHGAEFYAVYLPERNDLEYFINGNKLPYIELWKALEEFVQIIPTQNSLLYGDRDSTMDTLFTRGGAHYSAKGNRVIADVIAEALLKGRDNFESSFIIKR